MIEVKTIYQSFQLKPWTWIITKRDDDQHDITMSSQLEQVSQAESWPSLPSKLSHTIIVTFWIQLWTWGSNTKNYKLCHETIQNQKAWSDLEQEQGQFWSAAQSQ